MDLVSKYNTAAPRYTSYPTVPYWDNNLTEDEWKKKVSGSFSENNKDGISIYIHLPYCESLCTYCACNTRITVNHKVEIPYINALLKEWALYLAQFSSRPIIKEIHLGGGTPTFFSAENLQYLISKILSSGQIATEHDFSFEGHPSNTTRRHLEVLHELGFTRVSFGVQDFDNKVQDAINRFQSFADVKEIMETARSIGYTSINADLVYGLPHQDVSSVKNTVGKIISLMPERIAFYSYAHVPWLKPGQRKFSEKDLPLDSEKRKLYEEARKIFSDAGYRDVGMDHFSLASDNLYHAFDKGKLRRNFMGYTTNDTRLLIGLGCSAISDTWDSFSQNLKTVEEYIAGINEGKFAIAKGHLLTREDKQLRQLILDLMCRHQTPVTLSFYSENILRSLEELIHDGLAEIKNDTFFITQKGKLFIRNICLAFDKRYQSKSPTKNIFTTTA